MLIRKMISRFAFKPLPLLTLASSSSSNLRNDGVQWSFLRDSMMMMMMR